MSPVKVKWAQLDLNPSKSKFSDWSFSESWTSFAVIHGALESPRNVLFKIKENFRKSRDWMGVWHAQMTEKTGECARAKQQLSRDLSKIDQLARIYSVWAFQRTNNELKRCTIL